MPTDQRVEFEIALRDSISPGLRAISVQIRELNRGIRAATEEGSGGVARFGKMTGALGDVVKRTTRDVDVMANYMSGFAKSITGIGSITAGATLAAKSLENLAANRTQLKMMAIDTGFTTHQLGTMQQAMERMGLSTEESNNVVVGFSAKVREMMATPGAGVLYDTLAAMDQGSGVAMKQIQKLQQDATSGDMKAAWDHIVEFYGQQSERGKIFLSMQLQIPRSVLESYSEYERQVKDVFDGDQKRLDKFYQNVNDVRFKLEGEWYRIAEHVIGPINQIVKEMSGAGGEGHGISNAFIEFFDTQVLPTIQSTKRDLEIIMLGYANAKKGVDQIKRDFSPAARRATEILIGPKTATEAFGPPKATFNERFNALPHYATGTSYVPRTGLAMVHEGERITPASRAGALSSPGGDVLREMRQTEEDSNRTIMDIRDILRRMEDKQINVGRVGPGAPGYYGPGSAAGVAGTPGGPSGGAYAAPDQWAPGGSARLSDESGKPVDHETAMAAEQLGRAGDTNGLQKLFASRGYHMSGPACGIIASKYARAAGFAPPREGAIASRWHEFGQSMKPEDINAPGHPFGSMFGTYYHRRYGGSGAEVLRPGATGGHVMTIVPGTYNEKDRTVGTVDQYGFRRRPIGDIDFRFAGADAVAALQARRQGGGSSGGAGATGTWPAPQSTGPIDRSRMAAELAANPALRDKVLAIGAGENKESAVKLFESMLNRADLMNTPLAREARTTREGGYYAGYRPGELSNPRIRRNLEDALNTVLAGSNESDLATENASGPFGRRRFGSGMFQLRSEGGGEYYMSPLRSDARGAARYPSWREAKLREAATRTAVSEQTQADDPSAPEPGWSVRMNKLEQSRSNVDAAAGGGPRVKGSAEVNVNFAGMNSAQKTKTPEQVKEMFSNLKTVRPGQNERSGQVPPSNSTAYE